MGVIKVIITILLVIASLGGVLIFSYQFAQDNPFDTSHKHELTLVEATNPTCDTVGYRAHYKCGGCEKIFADENGYAAIELEEVIVKALGHNYVNAVCAGIRTCETCGITVGISDSHIPMAAVKENMVEGSCVEAGSYELVVNCKACGHEISREKVTTELTAHVNADGNNNCDVCGKELCKEHTPVKDPAVAATCTVEGYTEGSHCSVCNTVIVAQQIIPAAHSLKLTPAGTLVFNADGSFNTENFVLTMSCTACSDIESKTVTEYVIDAADPFKKGGVISVGDVKFSFPALDFEKYDVASTYDGNDKTPTVLTGFALKDTEFVFGVTTNHCIDLVGDGTVYSIYELDKLNNDNVTVTYDAESGYLYSSKQNHTISYLSAYGANITVTGDVYVLCAKRINVNTHLIIGTDSTPANLKIERAEAASSSNEIICLWQSAKVTVKNGTLTTVGKATGGYAVDIRCPAVSSTNPTADSVVHIEKNGKFITEGSGEYSVFFNTNTNARLIIDGTVITDRSFVVASNYKTGAEYEYGFEPALYIRSGNVTIEGAKLPCSVSSFQLGSEKENAIGSLSITSAADGFRMALKQVKMTFAKGTLNYTATVTDKTFIQTGGDGSGTAYYPYNDPESKKGYVEATIDLKKDMVFNATGTAGKNNYFIGCWRDQPAYVQEWLIEDGAQFNLTEMTFLAYIKAGNNVKLIAYEEAQLNIDGTTKTVKVASQLLGGITSANAPSALVIPELNASAAWTTDSATAAVNGWLKATDSNGNTIFYK